ncbi:MAG TPA: class I SAM-dependent methyltransferase [Ignavibacteriales bacterium]|nr:class I SAM-dependent methyltransferase [Ignavibacteriales bacterium]
MEKEYKYFKEELDKDKIIASMKKYLNEKQELDKFFEKLVSPYIENKSLNVLDACCGIGHLIYHMNKLSPASKFLGVDFTDYLIEEGRKIFCGFDNVLFENMSIYDLPEKYNKYFDLTVNWKTISWLPYYEEIIRKLMQVTKKHIFISSLFYDGYIDFEIKVREFVKESAKDGFNAYYNVYSYPKFKDFCLNNGAKNVEAFDFEINIDLEQKDKDLMGTYTLKLENGKRIQISGAVLMNWKVLRIDL